MHIDVSVGNSLNTVMSAHENDPFDQRTSPRTINGSSSSIQTSSTAFTGDDATRFKILRENVSSVSDVSDRGKYPDEDGNISAKAKFQKANNLTVSTAQVRELLLNAELIIPQLITLYYTIKPGGDGSYQGINSSLLGSKSNSTNTPSEAGRRSPSNMSQFSTASASSVMDDVLKLKQRMSAGSSRSRGPTPRISTTEDDSHHANTISDMLSKVATSPSSTPRSSKSTVKVKDEELKKSAPLKEAVAENEPNVSYHYFEHVDLDEQMESLQNELDRGNHEDSKWSTDALGSDSNSAFRRQKFKKVSPLTRHSTLAPKTGENKLIYCLFCCQ